MQERSWFRATGAPWAHPNIVAQVFFPFDRSNLDASDHLVLDRMVRAYHPLVVRGTRIELKFVGHADQRGNVLYNQKLGQTRATVVKGYLDRYLNWHRNYSSVQTTSPGELHAAQGRATRQRMAEDRRVDIYSSHVAQRHVIGQPIAITDNTQRIPRIVFRSFSRRAVTPLAGPPGASPSDRADERAFGRQILDAIVGGEREDFIAGPEGGRPSIEYYPVTFAVNDVIKKMHEEVTWERDTVERRSTTTTVRYTWGPPRPIVRLRTHIVRDVFGRRTQDEWRTRYYTRAEADSIPFIFPPNPD